MTRHSVTWRRANGATPPTARQLAGDVGTCVHCQRPIRNGQPYMTPIPFVGSWGGLIHQICPPRLVTSAPA